MASLSERITQAVVTRHTSPAMASVPAARVFRDLRGALQSELLPAIAIETGDEPDPDSRIGVVSRAVEIRVTVLAAGDTAYGAADPAHVESFARLLADPTLGGLAQDVEEGSIRRERDDLDPRRVAVIHTYRYRYRTSEGTLE